MLKCFDENKCDPAKLITENVSCLLYADDLVLVSESATGLQNCLDNLNKYIQRWKLSINFSKNKGNDSIKKNNKIKTDIHNR